MKLPFTLLLITFCFAVGSAQSRLKVKVTGEEGANLEFAHVIALADGILIYGEETDKTGECLIDTTGISEIRISYVGYQTAVFAPKELAVCHEVTLKSGVTLVTVEVRDRYVPRIEKCCCGCGFRSNNCTYQSNVNYTRGIPKIYPNPATAYATVEIEEITASGAANEVWQKAKYYSNAGTLTLVDANGRTVLAQPYQNLRGQLDVQRVPAGIYFLWLHGETTTEFLGKVVKTE